MKKQEYTITIFTEDKTGILSRVISHFTKRHINIESISASPSSIESIYRITILVELQDREAEKLVAQINKQVYVLKAFYYTNDEIVHQELALYKVPTGDKLSSTDLESLLRKHNAKVMSVEKEYLVIEKIGYQKETEELLKDLKETGVYEFVRSGRIAIVKPLERLNKYLTELDKNYKN